MAKIKDDKAFRAKLESLDLADSRAVGAMFVEPFLFLADDDRVRRALEAARKGTSGDELTSVFRSAKRAALDSHTRCGAEGDWSEQAAYFAARAATACVAPQDQIKAGGPAWAAAMAARMARTCVSIESDEAGDREESARQYKILNDFLKS